MAAEELELDICKMCLRCTVDTRSKREDIYSSQFRLKGNTVWELRYSRLSTVYHSLWLCRCSGSGVYPNPLNVSVMVESSDNGGIVHALSEVNRFTETYAGHHIWSKREETILRAVPEFRLHGVLKLLVVLKVEDFTASQTVWGVSVQTTPFLDVLPCLQSLSKDLDQLMVEGLHHDVEFQCAGNTTKAHKLIVCKRSPVIASMLATDMVERRTGVVKIPNMEPDIFTQFMRYIYSGQLEELTFDAALRLYEAGDQYSVLSLSRRCSEFLVEHLSVDNAYAVLVVADAHNDKECVEKVIDYMIENRVPLASEEWSAFCDEHSKLAFKVLNRAFAKNAATSLFHNPEPTFCIGTLD